MKKAVLVFSLLFFSVQIHAQSMKWHYNLKDVSFGQTTAKDVDGDGFLELIFSTYWNDSNVYCLNAENGTLKWKHLQKGPAGGCNDAGPLLFDPFLNGNYKVVIPGSCMDTTFCVDADSGYVQWKTVTGGGDSPPSMLDINGDGYPDALHGTFYGNVKALDGRTGATLYTLTVDANAAIESEPVIVKNGSEYDFVVGTWDFIYDSNRIACYRASDHVLKWQHYVHNLIYHGPATGDLFRTGEQEVVIGDYDGYLYCIKVSDGSLVWTDSVSKLAGGYIGAPVTLADLDNDGYLDIILSDGNSVRAVNRNDGAMWSYSPPSDFTNFRGVMAADVNNDHIKDITFGTNYGTVVSLDGSTGAVIRSFDLHAYAVDSLADTSSIFEVDNAPIIADFDHDGILDLFIIAGKGRSDTTTYNDYGYAMCLSWGVGNGPDWTVFRHDDRRTGCLCDTNGLPLFVPDALPPHRHEFTLLPNPASTEFSVLFSLDEPMLLTSTIYDITGRAAIPATTQLYPEGNNAIKYQIEHEHLSNGVYTVQVKGNGINEVRQLLVNRH